MTDQTSSSTKSTRDSAASSGDDTREVVMVTRDKGDGDTLRTIIIAVVIALVIRTFAFEPFNIPSGSMMPGLQVGDFLFVSKYTYGYSSLSTVKALYPFVEGRVWAAEPTRGDVVVFQPPPRPHGDAFIKRLIGMPGDVIEVSHGTVFVNGSPLKREKIGPVMMDEHDGRPLRAATEYVEYTPDGRAYHVMEEFENAPLDNYGPVTVPEGSYFLMGDNRDNSSDSRTPVVGFVPFDHLVGKARFLWFSLEPPARFWQFWTWPWSIRFSRMFRPVV